MINLKRVEQSVVVIMFFVSMALNAVLGFMVYRLDLPNRLRKELQEMKARQAKIGQQMPGIEGESLDGKKMVLSFPTKDGKGVIVYVFSATCHFCARNLDNLRALERQARGRYSFLGIALIEDGLDEYVTSQKLAFPILRSIPKAASTSYGLWGTPETIVLSSAGLVEGVWMGAYSKAMADEIENKLGVTLPGLLPEVAQTH